MPHFEHPNYKKFQPFERDINFNPDNYHERVNGFNAYKNSVNYIDDLVGELFETIKQNDLLKNQYYFYPDMVLRNMNMGTGAMHQLSQKNN